MSGGTPDDERWTRVLRRDRSGKAFVYAVTGTGIYCLPGCPARLPRRENVRFFATPAEARAAGFRPCKRCRPDLPAGGADDAADAALAAVRTALDAAETPPRIADLAAAAGLSPSRLHRLFRQAYGVTPREYYAARRLRRFADSLRPDGQTPQASGSVTRSLYAAGYGSDSRLYDESGCLGLTPGALRAGGAGAAVRYALGSTSLGTVLVAATEQGLCGVEFGNDGEELFAALRRRLPRASLRHAPDELADWVAQIAAFVERPAGRLDLPLDVAGTLFQRRVWKALCEVPPGETISYGELARRIGSPGATRAVGAACGANPAAVVIPCHRAVGGTGRLTGYRWGIARKQALLTREEALRTADG